MTMLSRHFSEAEFVRSQTATRFGLRNRFNPTTRAHAKALCEHVLEPLRFVLGSPITVSSGLRVKAVNTAVGGSSSSQHVVGQAADIGSNALSDNDLFNLIRWLDLPYDQLIEEYGAWVHVSYGPRHRRQALYARRRPGSDFFNAPPLKVSDAVREVVVAFQTRERLLPDGEVGPKTRTAMRRWDAQ